MRDGKTGPRMVPLTGPVLAVLDGIERMEGVSWVIRSKSDIRLTGLFSHWQQIRMDVGQDDVRVHDLRHTCASISTNLRLLMMFFFFHPNPSSNSHRIGCNS